MEKIKKILGFLNNKYFVYIVVILLLILLAFQCKRSNNLKVENIKNKQNIAAADTTIKRYKTKEGLFEAEKAIWILTKNELKKTNKELYKLVTNQNGKIISLNTSLIRLYQDTLLLHDSIKYLHTIAYKAIKLNNSEWSIPWELNYKWDSKNYDIFKGHTTIKVDTTNYNVQHINTQMDSRNSNIDLTFGEKVVDGKFNVYVLSKYPGFNVESLNGVFLDPSENKELRKLITKKHWFTGFSLNIGISPAYDFINGKPTIVIGPTFGFNIYQW